MKHFRISYLTLFGVLVLVPSLQAQISQLARILTMESRAAIGLNALERSSRGFRGAAHVPEYLSASTLYRTHYSELERSAGGSLFINSTINDYRPAGGRFVTEVEGFHKKNIMDVRPDELEPYLKVQYKQYAEIYQSVYHKNRLESIDSIMVLRLLYTTLNKQIWTSHSTLTSSGGGGGFVGNYPPHITDYPEYAHNDYRNREEEPEENDGEDDDDDDDDDQDDDSTAVSGKDHSNRYYTLLQDEEDARNNTAWLILGILAYWLFSSAGIWRIFMKAGKPSSVAFVPFWRLGQLAEVAGARAHNAWWLLVPGVNLVFWVKLNQRLCAKFQCPRSWAAIGIFLPGLLWLLIGYSNRYFIGKRTGA